jgi:hypothetical protein
MMAVYDLGDVVVLGITITDATGTPANATAVQATLTAPDGTTSSPSVTNTGTGLYDVSYTPTGIGRYLIRWVATGANASAYQDDFTVRDGSMLSIVELDEVKSHLNIAATNYDLDEEIRRFLDAATDLAEGYVGCVLGRQVFTDELYDGNTDIIRLRNPRAMSITSVYENDTLLSSTAYSVDPTGQRISRITTGSIAGPNYYGIWAPGANNIKISYVSGFINPPPAAKQGVLEIVRHLWQTQRGAMNVTTRNQTGDDFYPGSTYSLPRRCMELLDQLSLPGMA